MVKTGRVSRMAITIHTYHGTYNRSKRAGGLSAIKNLAIHYTGGTGSAKNNCIYFSTGNRNASADVFIDPDGVTWEYNNILDGYYTWAVGDGKGKYGITNSNSINVEVVNNGGAFTKAQIKALNELYNHYCSILGRKLNVVRHYDASRKSCPAHYVDNGRWNTLKGQIVAAQNKTGHKTELYPSNGTVAQRFKVKWLSDDVVVLKNEKYNEVLDVKGASNKSGTEVLTWPDNGGKNQQWRIIRKSGDKSFTQPVELEPVCAPGKRLDVSGASCKQGAKIIIWDAHGGQNQQWLIANQGNDVWEIINNGKGAKLALDAFNG